MIILNIEQQSEEWFKEKLGKPSASNASKLITNAGAQSKQRTEYMYLLASERITQERYETYSNKNMEVGNEREDESRKLFEMLHDVTCEKVGLVYKDEDRRFLCSPDSLINREQGLELKNVMPKTQVKRLLDNKLPSEYFGQVQFSLYVTGFQIWHFMSYCPKMKPLIIEVARDEAYIAALEFELDLFCAELDLLTEKIK